MVIPVFKGGNELFVQDTGRDGLVLRFVETDLSEAENLIRVSGAFTLSVGDEPVYAVALDYGSIILGTQEELASKLDFGDSRLADHPELRADLAEFVKDDTALEQALDAIAQKNAGEMPKMNQAKESPLQKKRIAVNFGSKVKPVRVRIRKVSKEVEKPQTKKGTELIQWISQNSGRESICDALRKRVSARVKSNLKPDKIKLIPLSDGKKVVEVRVTVGKDLCKDIFKIRVSAEGAGHLVQVLKDESKGVYRRTLEGKRQEVQERTRSAKNIAHRMRL